MAIKHKAAKPKPKAAPRAKAADKVNGNGKHGLGSFNVATAFDYFSNVLARTGYGTPSLAESSSYEMVRLSNNYWLMLTLYRNHWLARRIVDLPAIDMTRAWPKLVVDRSPDDIEKFDRTVHRTGTRAAIRKALKWARLYGGAGAVICIKGHEEFLDEPLDLDDVTPGSYLGLIPFDRWVGMYPVGQISETFDKPQEWGLPEYYEVRGTEGGGIDFKIHSSRILRFTGPEVPTPEFQAQIYWGLSVIEIVWEELRKRDNASWAILNLLFRAQIISQQNPELAQALSGLGMSQQALMSFQRRMEAQNELLSNQSMLILGENCSMTAMQYSFGGIGEVYGQFQMDTAGAAEMPVTRLFGRTITGLGQTNDADERLYEEKIATDQNDQLRPQLDKLYPVIAVSEFGEVPDDLDLHFPSVRVMTEEDKADLVDKASGPILAAYNAGIIWKKTCLKELKQLGDTSNIFTNITDEEVDEAEEQPLSLGAEPGAEGEGGEEGEGEAGTRKTPQMTRSITAQSGVRKPGVSALARGGKQQLPGKHKGDAALTDDHPSTLKQLYELRHDLRLECYGLEPGSDEWARCMGEINGVELRIEMLRQSDTGTRSPWPRFQVSNDQHPIKKRLKWHGLDVSIETPAGDTRAGKDPSGKPWTVKMSHDYGYIRHTEGVDGDHVDVFVGPDPTARFVYVVRTRKAPDFVEFDEDKCFLDFSSQQEAVDAFHANYDRPEHFGELRAIPVVDFIDKVLVDKKGELLDASGHLVDAGARR
jgi:hypothetical protein